MDKETNLKELLENIWNAKIDIFVGITLGVILAIILSLTLTPKYKATMIVAPADGYALGDYASSVQYDQIAALPFWRPKDQEGASTDFYRFMHTLRGPSAAEILMKDETVMKQFRKDYPNHLKKSEALAVYLNKNVRVDPLGATPLRRISYHHNNPEFAAALLRKIHIVADQMIRRDRRRQSLSRIEYLDNALNETRNPDHRKVITNLLMQQEHIQMLANLDEAYAAIIVEPAYSSPKPTFPNKTFMFSALILMGAFFGYMIYGFRKS